MPTLCMYLGNKKLHPWCQSVYTWLLTIYAFVWYSVYMRGTILSQILWFNIHVQFSDMLYIITCTWLGFVSSNSDFQDTVYVCTLTWALHMYTCYVLDNTVVHLHVHVRILSYVLLLTYLGFVRKQLDMNLPSY